jgi:hypothetical protein
MGGGLTLNFTRNSDDQSIKLWLEAADHMDQQKLTTLIQRRKHRERRQRRGRFSKNRISVLPESGHYLTALQFTFFERTQRVL